MKKRILSIMLILCMVFMFVPISANAMNIYVNLSIIGEDTLTLEVESSDRIESVKEKIKTETGHPEPEQILKYEGTVLEDGKTLDYYNIQKECTIELSLAEPEIPQSIPEGLEYTISGNEVTITQYNGSAAVINIPEKIEGKDVTAIGARAFNYCLSLTSITIPDSVTSIGNSAFYGCQSLTSIFLPDGLDVNSANIFNLTTQVRYKVDAGKSEAAITEITLGDGQSSVDIPATICGYTVVAAADGLLDKISSHTCAGGKATCQTEAICGICNEKYGNKAEHAYEWQSEDGQYWKKCKNCGDETAKKDIPTITINGADSVCRTQDYKFSFTLPEGVTDAVYGYEFENKGDLGLPAITENNEPHGVVSLEWYEPSENSFKVYAGAKTADGFEFSVSKTVEIQNEHAGGTATCTELAICDTCGELYGELDSSNHNLENIPAKDATVTATGNNEYWHCKDCGKYFADENGTNEIKLDDTVIQKLSPEIIDGKGQSISAGEKKALTFRSNAAFGDFIRVELDGKTLDGKNYTAKEGSTIVTLKADYVATLSAGKHTISIVSASGTADTTFTVDMKASAANSPKTGDNSHIALWIVLFVVSGGLLTVTGVYSKKKKCSER